MLKTLHSSLAERLRPSGLIIFGVVPLAADETASILDTRSACSAILIGNAGPDMWYALDSAMKADPALAAHDHPMNTWTQMILQAACRDLALKASEDSINKTIQVVFPFQGPPYFPFQKWAIRTGFFFPSPIGPLVHYDYGLWAGFRGAVVVETGDAILGATGAAPSPCESCADKPCLSACPVGAFSTNGYDVPSCAKHIGSEDTAACMDKGCAARRACPYGRGFHHSPDQARFHMDRFLAAHP